MKNVELRITFEGKVHLYEEEPLVDRFPDIGRRTLPERAGHAEIEFITPRGALTIEYTQLEELLESGAVQYMSKHPITQPADYRVAEYILEQMEVVADFDRVTQLAAEFGDIGYAVPQIPRIPFQQVLIDFFSTEQLFFALHDSPTAVERLIDLLDARMTEVVEIVADLPATYIEIGDNLDGMMTNPRLFRKYCLPHYQKYTELLHARGIKVGSHTDGNLQPLLGLLAESGLDVCESFSPPPLTPCTVEEALAAWPNGPIIWGAIPSPILEPDFPEDEFIAHIDRLLETVSKRPIILCITDMVLPINDIERVRAIAERVEGYASS
ncbi:MAG: hypothetical protein HC802_00915 [Caldilineaceae bacterium]|nr:hypothetical protein [Caldilineaceae bacterium]